VAAFYRETATVTDPDLLGVTSAPQSDMYNLAGVMAPSGFPFHGSLSGQTAQAATTESIAGLAITATVGPFWFGLY